MRLVREPVARSFARYTAQLASHLTLRMGNGLTRAEAGEVISHAAFYAGWPNAFSAMTVAKGVFEARAK